MRALRKAQSAMVERTSGSRHGWCAGAASVRRVVQHRYAL